MVRRRSSSEQGAIFIHVAIGLLVLLAFLAFVIDYGTLWVSRSQAQAAADAGALAGAHALAFDSATDKSDRARNVAWNAATRNSVWGASPSAVPASPYDGAPCTDEPDECIRVDVYRNGTNSSGSVPTFFANLFGRSSQGVRAMAVAYVGSANTSDCLKPFAIPDFFSDTGSVGFDPGVDTYNPLGYTLDAVGTEIALRQTDENRVAPGWFRLLDLMGGGGGGTSDLRDIIRSCAADPHGVGDTLIADQGVKNGIKSAVDDLIALDPNAYYDPTTKTVRNSCAETRSCNGYVWNGSSADGPIADPGRNYSPRIIPLAIFDPQIMANEGRIEIVNILGFFLEDNGQWTGTPKTLSGIIVNQPGLFDRSKGTVTQTSSFTKIIQLVR